MASCEPKRLFGSQNDSRKKISLLAQCLMNEKADRSVLSLVILLCDFQEGDMPIEDLLAMYYGGQTGPPAAAMDLHHDNSTRSSSEEEILSNQDLTLDKEEIARDLLKHDDGDDETSVHELLDSVEMPSQTIRLLRCMYNLRTYGDKDVK